MRRHIASCTDAVLPGGRRRLWLGASAIGWVAPHDAALLGGADPLVAADAAGLQAMARTLAQAGRFAMRGEVFDVRDDADGRVVATIDRGVLPLLGIAASGVHMNGLVRRDGAVWLWVARRAANKPLDPGKLDHLVAGGTPAGLSSRETLVKEAAEEAGIDPALSETATHTATLHYAMDRPEGLRRDRLDCYDLWLPETFEPVAVDGEVAGFELWPVPAVADRVRRTDDFKFNVNLVLIDLFLRLDVLPHAEAAALRTAMAALA